MIIARFIAGLGAFMMAFAGIAVAALGVVRLGEMLDGPGAAYAKGVIIVGVAGVVIVMLAGWWDSRGES